MERILVLEGGTSSEREVSLRSAAAVARALEKAGYDVVRADPAAADFDLARVVDGCDIVFPILHGAGGEDGTVQRQLDALGKPYLGSGPDACDLTFNKQKYRELVTAHGVRMAEGQVVDRAAFDVTPLRRSPYVLKPIDGGSSIDTLILHNTAEEPDVVYFDDLFAKYGTMLLEQLIEGPELTVGVLGDEPLAVIMVVPPSGELFDYENKYNGRTQEIVDPPQIPSETKQKAQELALQLHQLTSCRHLSRTDMFAASDGSLVVLETNTMPGMTDQSLFPKMAAAAGYDMPALVSRFVELAKGV